jgi:excisionase family DNA binding protein
LTGERVSLAPIHKELTTQEAADLLDVSRPFLIRLLDRGELPFTRPGRHRRVLFGDVVKYKQRRRLEREARLRELTRLSEDLEMYENEPGLEDLAR